MSSIIFIHCPKTAGCSISSAIGGCHAENKNPSVKDGHFALSRYAKELDESFVFAVARNPWDRLVSCYNYSNSRLEKDPKAYWLQKHDTFFDFVLYISQIDERFGLGGEKAFENEPHKLKKSLEKCHLRNITDCVSLDGIVRANFICEFSTLDEDWSVLSEKLGFPAALKRINCSSKNKDYRKFYTDKLAEIVARLYEKDISYFGYSFDNISKCDFKRFTH